MNGMNDALRASRIRLDDIRCDILDTGWPLGDDTDPELTPRRLVRELLARIAEIPKKEAAAIAADREAVVAYLYAEAERIRKGEHEPANRELALLDAADAIKQGRHRS